MMVIIMLEHKQPVVNVLVNVILVLVEQLVLHVQPIQIIKIEIYQIIVSVIRGMLKSVTFAKNVTISVGHVKPLNPIV